MTNSTRQCRERWKNFISPELIKTPFTKEDDELLISLHKMLGGRWAKIAHQLPGRTENTVKTRYRQLISLKRKDLARKGKG